MFERLFGGAGRDSAERERRQRDDKSILDFVAEDASQLRGKLGVAHRRKLDEYLSDVAVQPRANGRPICSGCGQHRPGYDRLPARRFQFVPLWGIAVFFVYALRPVDCPRCGVKVERVLWAAGKEHVTTTFQWFLARWAKRLSWQEVADVFWTSWNTVYRAVTLAVLWGIANRSLEGITGIGIDEIQWRKGHKYLTLVYQIQQGCKRLLCVAAERTEESLRGFFDMLGKTHAPWSSLAATCGSRT